MRHAMWAGGALVIFASSSAQAFGDPSALLSTRADQIATLAFADAAVTSDKIARDASFDPALRKTVALETLRLRVMLGDRAGTQATVAVARGLHPSHADQVVLDAAMPDLDWQAWQRTRNNHAAQTQAVASLSSFYAQHRHDVDARERLVITASRLSIIKRTTHAADVADWTKATVTAWDELDSADHAVASLARLLEHVMEAELAMVDDEIARAFSNPLTCRYSTYRSDAARVDAFDARLERTRSRHSSAAWVAGVEARRGILFDALRDGVWLCPILRVVPVTPAQAAALVAEQEQREKWVGDAEASAWRHFARAFDAFALADGSNDTMQHAARRADLLRTWVGDAQARRLVESTTSLVRVGVRIDYQRVMRAVNSLAGAPP